jgi:hypothetical protein
MPRQSVKVLYETTPGVWLQVDPDRGEYGGAVIDVATAPARRVSIFSAVNLDPTSSRAKVKLPPEAARALRDALTRAIVDQDQSPRDQAILAIQEAMPRV